MSFRPRIIIGGGGVIAGLLFFLSALILQGWIPISARDAIIDAFRKYGFGYAVLLLTVVVLFVAHEKLWLKLLREKNAEIRRLIESRNRLENLFLRDRGTSGVDD